MTKIKVMGRLVGEVRGSVFYKRVRGRTHFLQTPPAIAFDKRSLFDAEQAGARHVEILDTETGIRYRAPIRLLRQRGFTLDRGFGEQIALPMKHWTVVPRGGEQMRFA